MGISQISIKAIGLTAMTLSIIFLCDISASSLTWFPKRNIGKTIIWKHHKLKGLRASSRLKAKSSILPTIHNRTKLIKDFEQTKRKALSLTGVKDWQASDYKWQGRERLIVTGQYKDRKGKKITFSEVHLYRENHRLIIVVTHDEGKEIASKSVEDLVETIIKAEALP